MHVNIIAVGIEIGVENKRRIHKRTRVDQAASLTNLHFFDIEDKAPIEDVESDGTLATEQQDLVVCDLVSQAHVGGHPVRLVDLRSTDLLPNVSRNVIYLDCINNTLLIYSAPKGKDVVVLEDTKGGSSTRHSHISDELPFILLGIVNFTVSVDLVSNKSSNDIDEVLNGADRMICMRVVHVAHGIQDSKEIIVSVAILQIYSHMLHIASSEVNCTRFRGN